MSNYRLFELLSGSKYREKKNRIINNYEKCSYGDNLMVIEKNKLNLYVIVNCQ